MAKLTTTDLTQLSSNETSAVNAVNNNMTAIETALENTLSRDGTTPNTMTADIDLNSNKVINVADPTNNQDVVTLAYGNANFGGAAATAAAVSAAAALVSEGNASTSETNAGTSETNALTSETNAQISAAAAQAAAAGMRWKDQVLVATTANVALTGEQTIDGVLTSASRVLVKANTAQSENGIYVTAAGAWARAIDMDTWDEVPSSVVPIEQGTAGADSAYICTSDTGGTLGSTAITWASFGSGDLLSANNLSDVAVVATARTNLGLAIGSDVQAYDVDTAKLDVAQTWTGDQTLGPITETQTTKSASFTPSVTAEGTVYSCTGTITITMPTATAGKSFTIIHATGDTITWAGTILWPAGTAPTAAAAIEIYTFVSDGTNWYGFLAGTGFA